MHSFRRPSSRSKFAFATAAFVLCIGGAAAFAHADWRGTILPRVESELRQQSEQLEGINDSWADSVKDRIDFAIYKLQNARLAVSPMIEETHLEHACQALNDERDLLVDAQLTHSGEDKLLETLIEKTFEHRELLGCAE